MSIKTEIVSKVRFTADEDELLIEYVKNHTVLYALKDPEYRNTLKKEVIWNEAGKRLNREGKECKKRWKSVRDHYKRVKKEEKRSAAKMKRAAYWERLGFLDAVEDERDSFTDVPSAANSELSTFAAESDIADWDTEDEGAPTVQTDAEQTPAILKRHQSDDSAFRPTKSKRRRENSTLEKYLKERKERKEHYKRYMEEIVKLVPQENEIDLFFKTVAATVRKFRPDIATRTKAKMFEIVTEMELLNLQSQPLHTTKFTNAR